MGTDILATGAAGFVGSNFVHLWLSRPGASVVNVDKLTYAANPANLDKFTGDPRYTFVQGDIGDRELVSRILREYRPDAVINFAAETHVDRSIYGPEEFIRTNVVGTFGLLECVREYWAALDAERKRGFRFLHVSTDEVYGSLSPSARPSSETSRYEPNSPYAASKAASDHLVRSWHKTYGLPVVTTNCCNNYGPFQYPEKLMPLVILNALGGMPLPIYGDGKQVRDWLFVEDHCHALREVLAAGRVGETYNIGGNCERTNIELVETICQVLDELAPRGDGQPYREQISFVTDRAGHDRRCAINAGKIERELGWRPRTSLENGIRKTVAWFLANGDRVGATADREFRHWLRKHYHYGVVS